MLKKNKGITLIALVITIIVLIILAGISINLLLGDNGIIKKAQSAGEESEKASDLERIKLAVMEATIDKATTGNSNLETALRNNLDGSKLQSVSSNGTVAKINYNGKEYSVDLKNGTASQSIVDKWDGVSKSIGLVGEGTDAKPYLIRSGNDLNYLSDRIANFTTITGLNEDETQNNCDVAARYATVKLMNDISLENHPFQPIGGVFVLNNNSYGSELNFRGVFDGNNHEISNVKIVGDSNGNASFFGYVSGAIIKDLIVTNLDVTGEREVAGLIGHIRYDSIDNKQNIIRNCYVQGKVIANEYVENSTSTEETWYTGGIVAACEGNTIIENCTTDLEIKSSIFVGGIVGWINNYRDNIPEEQNYSIKIKNCTVNGKVEGNSKYAGIAGEIDGANIINCVSNAEIKSSNKSGTTNYAAGLIGYIRGNLKMENTHSTGNITINRPIEYIGSFAGFALGGNLINCYNTGNITCTNTVNKLGGLYGEIRGFNGSRIICTNSYNSGNITYDTSKAGTEVGKLIGSIYNEGTEQSYEFTGCSNTGTFPISQEIGVIH